MRKIYHLSTCQTCKKVIAALDDGAGFTLQDIKTQAITAEQLDALKAQVGSYADLFSRRAIKYRTEGWRDKELTEKDYRDLILREYTFLKRPVIVIDGEVWMGSSKKTLEAVQAKL